MNGGEYPCPCHTERTFFSHLPIQAFFQYDASFIIVFCGSSQIIIYSQCPTKTGLNWACASQAFFRKDNGKVIRIQKKCSRLVSNTCFMVLLVIIVLYNSTLYNVYL